MVACDVESDGRLHVLVFDLVFVKRVGEYQLSDDITNVAALVNSIHNIASDAHASQ